MFQAIQDLSALLMNLCFGVFCKFLGDFGVCLGRDSFLKELVKFREIKIIDGFNEVLKLELMLKLVDGDQYSPLQT